MVTTTLVSARRRPSPISSAPRDSSPPRDSAGKLSSDAASARIDHPDTDAHDRGRRNRFAWRDDLCRRLHLGDDQWHDGRLVGLSIDTSRRGNKPAVQVTLRVDVYGEGAHASQRTPLTATFGGVRELVTTINCAELVDMGESHIVFARLNETSEMLDLGIHLAGGHVRIVAEHLAVSTPLIRGRRARQR